MVTEAEKERREEVIYQLSISYPGSARELCELDFESPFELLVATVLSAQCTDKVVNAVTKTLFSRYPDASSLAGAPIEEIEALVRPTGFYRNKSKHIVQLSQELVRNFDGEVPKEMKLLTSLPGVGRKTANVVLPISFNIAGLAVDTHVMRLSKRLGLSEGEDPLTVESDLCSFVEPCQWAEVSLRLILHGRRVCKAVKPTCWSCSLAELCPYISLT